MIGRIIQNYKITAKIAEGGMGTIFYGEHKTLNRPVAIKQLHANFTSNEQFKKRFVNEAKILAQLNHPNIISVYDLIEDGGEFFIIMEYVKGKTLDVIIEEFDAPFNPKRALYIFKQILYGFEYAHKKGVIHRDIKPSNIILQEDDTPKILDFGVAKMLQKEVRITKAGTKMGSLLYMSPEQVLGLDVDVRSDIYSLGVVLFEILTASLPYDLSSDNEYEIMEAIIKYPLKNLANIRNDIDSNISNVILKACAKDTGTRFYSCREFQEALEKPDYNYQQPKQQQSQTRINENYQYQSNKTQTKITQPPYSNSSIKSQKSKGFLIGMSIVLIGIIFAIIILILSEPNSSIPTSPPVTPKPNTEIIPPTTPPPEKSSVTCVREFITDLGNGNCRSAYDRTRNKSWGSYDFFCSTRAYGSINRTEIREINSVSENSYDAQVYVFYYADDPANKNGWYKQYFNLQKFGSEWKIVKIKNIEISQW
ncbi:MAG TPA: serine/threonine-protein kinase [Ignavibacteria bacterium]